MTIKEAIRVFIWCDKRPAYRCSAAMIREAQEVLEPALHAQQTPAKLDRSRWEGCPYCEQKCCYSCKYGTFLEWGLHCSACCMRSEYKATNFCPVCGHPLTEEAWAELERRINGGTTD